MAFTKKTWVDRLVEFAGRRKLTNVSTGSATVYNVERAEGVVQQEGTAFSAANMNDLETRIEKAINNMTAKDVNAVSKSGDTMTGDLTLSGAARQVKYASDARTGIPIAMYKGDANGSGLVIGDGGRTIIGGGESAQNLRTALGTATTNESAEEMHVAGDGTVQIHSNCQTITSRKTFTFNTDGTLSSPAGFRGSLLPGLTGNRALVSNGSGGVAASAVTSTELGYLDGVTKNIQTQLNAIKVYVGSDGKIHFTAAGGADSALNFNPSAINCIAFGYGDSKPNTEEGQQNVSFTLLNSDYASISSDKKTLTIKKAYNSRIYLVTGIDGAAANYEDRANINLLINNSSVKSTSAASSNYDSSLAVNQTVKAVVKAPRYWYTSGFVVLTTR